MVMALDLRLLIFLAAIIQFAAIDLPVVSPDWFLDQARSQIAASQLAEQMSAMK